MRATLKQAAIVACTIAFALGACSDAPPTRTAAGDAVVRVAGLDPGVATAVRPYDGRSMSPPGEFELLACSAHGNGIASVELSWTADPGVEFPVDTTLTLGIASGRDVVDGVGTVLVTLSDEGGFAVTVPEAFAARERRERASSGEDLIRVGAGAPTWTVLNVGSWCDVEIGGEPTVGRVRLNSRPARLEANAPDQTVELLAQKASGDGSRPLSLLTWLYGHGWDLHSDRLWVLDDGTDLDAMWESRDSDTGCFGIDMKYEDLNVRQQTGCGPPGGDEVWQAGTRWFVHIEDGEWDVLLSSNDADRVREARDRIERFTYLSGTELPAVATDTRNDVEPVHEVAVELCPAPSNDDPAVSVRSPAACLDDSPFEPIKVTVRDRRRPDGQLLICVKIREGGGSEEPCGSGRPGLIGDRSDPDYYRAAVLATDDTVGITVVTRSGFEITAPVFGSASFVYWARSQGQIGWLEASSPSGVEVVESLWDER